MNIAQLKEVIKDLPDDMEIYVRNSHNICGNISELAQVEKSSVTFFGKGFPCIILNSLSSKEDFEETIEGDIVYYIEDDLESKGE